MRSNTSPTCVGGPVEDLVDALLDEAHRQHGLAPQVRGQRLAAIEQPLEDVADRTERLEDAVDDLAEHEVRAGDHRLEHLDDGDAGLDCRLDEPGRGLVGELEHGEGQLGDRAAELDRCPR